MNIVNHGDHVADFTGGIGHASVPETGISDQEAAFGCISPHRRHDEASLGFVLDTYSLFVRSNEVCPRPQFSAAVVYVDIRQSYVDYKGCWRMWILRIWPQRSGISMQWLHLALRAVRVSVVEPVVHAVP